MKAIVIGVLLTVTSLSQAAVEFQSGSKLSKAAQAEMVKAIHSQCPLALENDWPIYERATVQQQLSSGQYVRSTFTVYGSTDDQFQPENGDLVVEALVGSSTVQVLHLEGLCH